MKEPRTLDCLSRQFPPCGPVGKALASFAFAVTASLLPFHAQADSPVHYSPAITPLDKEQDRLDKQLLEEKITRELKENRRLALEKSAQEKRNGTVAPAEREGEDLSHKRRK